MSDEEAERRREARAHALDLLARREHSSEELKRKLLKKGFAEGVVVEVIADLGVVGLVSDARFAESRAGALRRRGFGPLHIRHDLQAKGVDAELIMHSVDMSDQAWIDTLTGVRDRKFGAKPPCDATQRAKQIRFLQSRGFTLEQIRRVLNSRDSD